MMPTGNVRTQGHGNAGSQAELLLLRRGSREVEGFTTIDVTALLSGSGPVRIPLGDDSVSGACIDHVLESLEVADMVAMLRECRRVLQRGAWLRIVTVDLEQVVALYHDEQRWYDAGLQDLGYDFRERRAQLLNRLMRAHLTVLDRESVLRLARLVGLRPAAEAWVADLDMGNADIGVPDPQDLELVLQNPGRVHRGGPEVSLLIPQYKSQHFRQCLQSALDQTHKDFEILVSDDSPDAAGRPIVEGLRDHPAFGRLRYHHNADNLGDARNYLACLARARGRFIKFLNDDDLLEPSCVERMAACLRSDDGVSLVCSRRHQIDEHGKPLDKETCPDLRWLGDDCVISGPTLLSYMARHHINVVGEPTCVMFRAEDVALERPDCWSLSGLNLNGNGDVSLWAGLLSKGNAVYLQEPLATFRVHRKQVSADSTVRALALHAWERFSAEVTRLGIVSPDPYEDLDHRPLWPRPWWASEVRERMLCAPDAQAHGPPIDATTVDVLAAARSRSEFDAGLETAYARALIGADRHVDALAVLKNVITRAPFHRPAHLVTVALLRARGATAPAQAVLANAHRAMPLLRPVAGVEAHQGRTRLRQRARFSIPPGAPGLRVLLRVTCRLPYVVPPAGGVLLSAYLQGREVIWQRFDLDGQTLEFQVDVPALSPGSRPGTFELHWSQHGCAREPDVGLTAMELSGIGVDLAGDKACEAQGRR